jgi:hypothetical protein
MNFKYKAHLLLVILIGTFLVQNSMAQNIKLKAKLDSISIEIGDQVWLSLSAEQNRNEKVLFPSFKDRIIEGIDLIETSNLDTQAVNNQKIIVTKKFLITAFEDSIFTIPPFSFRYNSDTLYTDSLLLMVNYVRIDSAEFAKIDTSQVLKIFDVKDPINTPWTLKEFIQIYYPYILTFIGIALFVALLAYYIKQRKKNKPFIKLPEKPKEPAHLIALRALDELKAKKLWQSEKVKLYYSELSEILRGYIENRFSIHTFEKTSHEVLESLKHSSILEKEQFMELKQILGFADLAKFAKYIPLADENDMCLKNAYHFVNATILVEKVQLTDEIIQTEN